MMVHNKEVFEKNLTEDEVFALLRQETNTLAEMLQPSGSGTDFSENILGDDTFIGLYTECLRLNGDMFDLAGDDTGNFENCLLLFAWRLWIIAWHRGEEKMRERYNLYDR